MTPHQMILLLKYHRIIVQRNISKLSQGYRTSEIVKIKWSWNSNQNQITEQ